ncbi:MAG TPA: M64 family metallopeptidase [Vicinamibacterales bacterium]|nr:M64 family metallopeptidase [Vicinamibacterales bacterium]
MRVDYFHRGGPRGEVMTLDRVSNDGPWPGSLTQLIDNTALGKYFFEVIDIASARVLYSRGFASIYGEWETTPEVRTTGRTFHESLRFPWPDVPVRIMLRKRDERNAFRDLWTADVDPRTVSRTGPPRVGRVVSLLGSGSPATKVDLLLISEGYTAEQLPRFRADASRLVEALFALEPFKARRLDFNVRLLEIAGSRTSVEFNIFGIERYALTYDNRALRDLAASAPYDAIAILVNERKYGGGGIFNQLSTVAAANGAAEYVFIHEFAHNLAGLADEYVGNVTYETGAPQRVEPWEPNLTALLDPAALKWRDLVEAGTSIPTPLAQAGKVGAFEGGGYEARNLYRPEAECIMGSRKAVPFCRVCQRAISRIIDLHSK